jgi:small nuclear ribonucleoprotein (snRNP)-like protein
LYNALRAYLSAIEQDAPKTLSVLENALGFTSISDLKTQFKLLSDEKIEGRVGEFESYLNAYFACNFKEIEKNEDAKASLTALRVIVNNSVN